jgi:phosphate transport system substrate-binding protein
MTAVAVDAGKGPVLPSLENVTNATYTPLSRPLFIYVKDTSAARPEVKEFVQFVMTRGDLVKEAGYLQLPKAAYDTAWKHFTSGRLGSVFGGVPKIGLTIDQLLAMEAKL